MVSSTVPSPAAKCPPRVATFWMRKSRNSVASCGSSETVNSLRSRGDSIRARSGYLSGEPAIVPKCTPALLRAIDGVARQLGEHRRRGADRRQRGDRAVAQLLRFLTRGFQTD